MRAKNLVKVTGIGEVMGIKRPPTLWNLLFQFRVLSKQVVLIMRIINIITNMGDIRKERPKKGPILKLNERLKQKSLNKQFGTHIKEFMVF